MILKSILLILKGCAFFMKRIIAFILSLCLIGGAFVSAENGGGVTLDIKAPSSILIEANTGKILYENNKDERLSPASITKIMSLILVMEALNDGKFNLDTVLVCSETAAALGGSQIWLEPGEEMTVNDLLKAVVIVSANDATVLLAEAVAGSEESFVYLMNEKAKALGMNNTNFCNATGLDAENHYSSAQDVAIMASELLKYEMITNYSTVWMDTLRNGESELVNTNRLVRFYEGCTGLKTGTTSTAGYCLAASAKRNNLSLVAVVMNAPSSNDRFADAQKLLNYGFANYSYIKIEPELTGEERIAVKKGVKESITLRPEGEFSALLKKSDTENITQKVNISKEITAGINEGDIVGNICFYLGEEEIGNLNIVAAENCEKLTFFKSFGFILRMMVAL